jgi:hypothetical protein
MSPSIPPRTPKSFDPMDFQARLISSGSMPSAAAIPAMSFRTFGPGKGGTRVP